MNYQVIYFSRKGSTKKVADAIASTIKVESKDVKKASLKKDSMLF
jgi:flavodoxin